MIHSWVSTPTQTRKFWDTGLQLVRCMQRQDEKLGTVLGQ